VYIIGMGLISWNGQFAGGAVKPPLNTDRIPFWVDIPVVAAWAVIIFIWAYFAALPREEMELVIAEQAGVAADIAAVGTAE